MNGVLRVVSWNRHSGGQDCCIRGGLIVVICSVSLKKIHELVCPNCKPIKLTYFILIFSTVHFLISHLPNFNSMSIISLAAAVMSLSYSTIAWIASLVKGVHEDVDYSARGSSPAARTMIFFTALGDIAFSFDHSLFIPVTFVCSVKDTPELMKQMPPIPVKLNQELMSAILPQKLHLGNP